MARVSITPTNLPGKFPTAPATFTFTACDATNKEQFPLTEREILLFYNSSADTARSFTITSVADPITGRTGDITVSMAFGTYRAFGPIDRDGFMQTDGALYFEGTHAEMKYAVLRLPS